MTTTPSHHSIEIEKKTFLTKDTYIFLMRHFFKEKTSFRRQENFYFSTLPEATRVQRSLRIRKQEHINELSFKPTLQDIQNICTFSHNNTSTYILGFKCRIHDFKALEIEEEVHEDILSKMQATGQIPNAFYEKISMYCTQETTYIGSLTTLRLTFEHNHCEFALDMNMYNSSLDYELEVEGLGVSEEHVTRVFDAFLKEYHIPYTPSPYKIQRFQETLN